jgi:hypothetical protein
MARIVFFLILVICENQRPISFFIRSKPWKSVFSIQAGATPFLARLDCFWRTS